MSRAPLRQWALAVLCLAAPSGAVAAQAAPLAEYWARSGSLPPEYAWSVDVSITADGHLTLKHCKGYETEGPACRTRSAKVDRAHLDAILAVTREAGLDKTPVNTLTDIPVGGGTDGGAVWLDGQKIDLPPFPAEGDAARVRTVLAAITDAIPQRLKTRFLNGN
jgi:hypothetical protein